MKVWTRLLLFCVGLLMAEGAARVLFSFYYQSPRLFTYGFRYTNLGALLDSVAKSKLKAWEKKEGIRTVLRQVDFSTKNSYGFIGPEFSVEKPAGTYRIFAMGGSTTVGNLGSAKARLYPYTGFLQGLFDRRSKKNGGPGRVEVINAGKSGMDLKGIYRRLQERVLPLDPDLIIISSGWNNIQPITAMVQGSEERVAFQATLQLSRYSLFVVGLRAALGRILRGDSSWTRIDRKKAAQLIREHPALPSYRNLLVETVRLLQRKGICVLLVRQPYEYPASLFKPPNRLYYLYPMIHIYEIMGNVSRKYVVPVVDAEGHFNRMPEKYTLFTDGLHLTPEGYEILATVIYRFILDNGLLEKKGCRG